MQYYPLVVGRIYRIDDLKIMSNELFTPIVLQCNSYQDPQQTVEAYIADLKLENAKAQIQYINTELGNTSIETIRSLIEDLSYSTSEGTLRVFALLAAESITLPAQQAILKSLEEPPTRTLLILVTSQPQALLPTILSRCEVVRSEIGSETKEEFELPDSLKALMEKPDTVSFSQCIELAEGYKDRGEALVLINNLLQWIQKNGQPGVKVKWTNQLVITLQLLKQNVNVQLALEECFFSLK
jgi:hypothetical protein